MTAGPRGLPLPIPIELERFPGSSGLSSALPNRAISSRPGVERKDGSSNNGDQRSANHWLPQHDGGEAGVGVGGYDPTLPTNENLDQCLERHHITGMSHVSCPKGENTLTGGHRDCLCWNDRHWHSHLLRSDPGISWRSWSDIVFPRRRRSGELRHGVLGRDGFCTACCWSHLRLSKIVYRSRSRLRCWHRLLVMCPKPQDRSGILLTMNVFRMAYTTSCVTLIVSGALLCPGSNNAAKLAGWLCIPLVSIGLINMFGGVKVGAFTPEVVL